MANEFIIKNGFFSQGSSNITGSLTVSQGITGSLLGTASYASSGLSSSYALTASYIQIAQTASYVLNAISSSYAATSSYSPNLTISGSITSVNYIDFNTGSATPTWKSGRVYWNNTDGCLDVYNAEADITLQVGQENWTRIFNDTGVAMANGTVVRLNGTHGDVPTAIKAQSIAVSGSVNVDNQILGLTTHDIEAGTFGYVTTQGLVRGLNTNAFNDGETLYVSTTAGAITNVPPTAPYEIITIGVCVKAHPGASGIIYVAVQQPIDFSDLSSALVGGTYTIGDLWVYKNIGGSNVWTHTNQLTGSYVITGSLNATKGITGSLAGTASYADQAATASYVNTLNQNVLITGSLTILQGATIYGSSSFQYITASQLAVSASYISVNVFEPVQRFGGLYVHDSGSSTATASLTWDSFSDRWVYTNASGSSYSGGIIMSGPRNTGSLGEETPLNKWFIPRSDGGDHLDNTQIYSSGSIHIVTGSLTVTGGITGSLNGTSSWSNNAQTASYVQTAQTASYVLNAISSSFASTASYVQNAQTASYVQTAQTASYVLNAISSSFASTASSVNRLIQDVIITGSLIVSSSNTTNFQVGSRSLFVSSSGNIGIGTLLPTSSLHISGTTNLVTIQGSGSSAPLLSVIGSSGSIFTVNDTLSGSIFSVTDLSNQPVLQVFSDGTSLMGSYQFPVLYTSTVVYANSGSNVIYSFSSSVYSSAYFDYNIRSGSNGRAGSIAMMWVDSAANFIETKTADFGSTSGFTFAAIVSGSNVLLTGSCSTSGWTIKTSVRAI